MSKDKDKAKDLADEVLAPIERKKASKDSTGILAIDKYVEDANWYRDNILPGIMTWVNTTDAVLFAHYVSIAHELAAHRAEAAGKKLFTDAPKIHYAASERIMTMHREDDIIDGKVTDMKIRNDFHSIKSNAHLQAKAGDVTNFDKIYEDIGKGNYTNNQKRHNMVFFLRDADAMFQIFIKNLMDEFNINIADKVRGKKMNVDSAFPKFVFVPMHPSIEMPAILSRNAVCVNFDDVSGRFPLAKDLRVGLALGEENYAKFEQMAFPPTAMEATVAFEEASENVNELLSRSLIAATPGLKRIENAPSPESIGGYKEVKDWAINVGAYMNSPFYSRAERPKHILIVGPPGTGKSSAARAVSAILGWPGLELDISEMMSSLQGGSEGNLNRALNTIRSIGKCVVLLDEVEKALGGATSSTRTDGGVLMRMVNGLLRFTEAEDHDAIIVYTANSVSDLPPALMRAGRVDQIFFAGLPEKAQRRAIFDIYLQKYKLNLSDQTMKTIVDRTEGYSGAEMKQIISKTRDSFIRQKKYDFSTVSREEFHEAVVTVMEKTIPVSKSRPEEVQAVIDWANGRALPVD